jgi:hypothetical protein
MTVIQVARAKSAVKLIPALYRSGIITFFHLQYNRLCQFGQSNRLKYSAIQFHLKFLNSRPDLQRPDLTTGVCK